MGLGGEYHRGAFSHAAWRLIYHQHGLSLSMLAWITWLRLRLSRFSTGVTAYTNLFPCRSLWRKSVCTARIWGASLENGVSTFVTLNSSQREICLLPIYLLFSHLFISIWTHGSLIHTLGSNPILLYYFFAQIVPILTIGCWVLLTYTHQETKEPM